MKKNRAGGIRCSDLKPCYKAALIKTVWCWHRNRWRSIEQSSQPRGWGRGNSHVWGWLIYSKGAKTIQWARGVLPSKGTCGRMRLGRCLSPHTKMSLKWIKSLNLTGEILKLAEGNRGSVLTLVLVMIFFCI